MQQPGQSGQRAVPQEEPRGERYELTLSQSPHREYSQQNLRQTMLPWQDPLSRLILDLQYRQRSDPYAALAQPELLPSERRCRPLVRLLPGQLVPQQGPLQWLLPAGLLPVPLVEAAGQLPQRHQSRVTYADILLYLTGGLYPFQ